MTEPGGFPFIEGDDDDQLTDDNFHTPETDEWWEHETIWFWWFNAERKLGAWNYHYLRPNIGVAGGGLFVFDDTTWLHLEAPYYFNYSNTPMPEQPDFRDFTFPSGERIQMLDPLHHYRITFADRDSIDLELDWRAVGKPWVRVGGQPHTKQGDQSSKPRHFDQFGHVTGALRLHGESIPIDCYAMRDRSWWHLRPEFWKRGGGTSTYITCMADPDTAFFGAGPGGFLLLDGVRRPLLSGSVRRERDADWGFMRRIVVTGTDTDSREFEAVGDSVSRMATPISGVAGVCWQSLVRYEFNGVVAYGDDQDAWPLSTWAAFRRTEKGLPDGRSGRFGPVD
ncbi:MAG TPA: hypothetical protein VHI95_06025 [Acidimicrobiales bacterium]|jgi:hypothetical protein|nr:hypothetical protein [Acidimicrobiales bacterium]